LTAASESATCNGASAPGEVSSGMSSLENPTMPTLTPPKVSTTTGRTAEQGEIALFWVERSPLRWSRIARTVATSERLDLWQSARLFALLNVALADGYIGTFETKYHYLFWGPSPPSSSPTPMATPPRRPTRHGRRYCQPHPSRTTTRDTLSKAESVRRS
jgi:hypothetical protein